MKQITTIKMQYYQSFKYCPVCSNKYKEQDFDNKKIVFNCPNCRYSFYQNNISTTSAIIPSKDDPFKILFTKRNIEPEKGKIDLPGGFLNYSEEVEEGIKREIKEELGLTLKIHKLFDTRNNDYMYKGLNYKHTTTYVLMEPISKVPDILDKNENSSCKFYDLVSLSKFQEQIAFNDKFVAQKYLEWLSTHNRTQVFLNIPA